MAGADMEPSLAGPGPGLAPGPGVILVAGLQPGQGQHLVADAPAAVGDLLDEDHGGGPGPLPVELGVQVGGAVDDGLLLLGGQRPGRHLEVRERHELPYFPCGSESLRVATTWS